VVTNPLLTSVGIGAPFDVHVSAAVPPTVVSPDVVARYRRISAASDYAKLKTLPILQAPVPIWSSTSYK
jgi:hypothetical protein